MMEQPRPRIRSSTANSSLALIIERLHHLCRDKPKYKCSVSCYLDYTPGGGYAGYSVPQGCILVYTVGEVLDIKLYVGTVYVSSLTSR